MGVSFIGAGAASTAASPASASPAFPTGTSEPGPDDYILIVWTARGVSCTPNTPANWTLLDSHTNTTSNVNRVYIFGRHFVPGMTTPSITVNGTGTNETMIVQAFAFGGVDIGTPIEVVPTWTDGASSQNCPAQTAVNSLGTDTVAVAIAHRADDWTSVAPDGTWLEMSEADATVGTDAGISVSYKKMPTAASSSTYAPVVTGGLANTWTGCIFILGRRAGVQAQQVQFENGSNGNTIAAGTTCPEIFIASGAGTIVYSNAQTIRGSLSALMTATGGSVRFKFNCRAPGPLMYSRAYYYISDTTPGTAIRVMEMEDYPGTPLGSIAISPTAIVRVQTSGGGNVVNSGVTMAANTWYRFEMEINVAGNTTTCRIYTGAQLHAIGTDYTGTAQTSVSASVPWVERVMYGCGTTEATAITVDDAAISNETWIGPAAYPQVLRTNTPKVPVHMATW